VDSILGHPHRRLFVVVATIVLGAVLLVGAGIWVFGLPHGSQPRTHVTAIKQNSEATAIELAAALAPPAPPPPAGPPPPGQLIIPSLNISGAVFPVGVDRDGNMDVTKNAFTVGWYSPGPVPGQTGDSVMTCHNQWYSVDKALCYSLYTIQNGAEVMTKDAKGNTRHFRVDRVLTVPFNASVPDLFSTAGPPRLSVITCGGVWDRKNNIFTLRVIVDAHLVA
jgi:sortase (surface protein transpeptidase)